MLLEYRTLRFTAYALFGFLFLPLVIVAFAAINSAGVLSFPPQGISLKWFSEVFGSDIWLKASVTSVEIAALATIASVTLAFMSALSVVWWGRWRGLGAYSLLMILPLIFPFTATGVALVLIFRQVGLLGTFVGFLIAHVLVTIPYAFRAILVSLSEFDYTYFEASQLLGAGALRSFAKVVLPLIRPGIATAAIFAALISFDEATVSLLLVGPFITTLPVEMYQQATQSPTPAVAAVATVQVLAVALFALAAKWLFGMKALVTNVT